jgi:hypothetical protein
LANSDKKIRLGRPKSYSSVAELTDAIEKYLNETDLADYTISGLCIALGVTRETLNQWSKPSHSFSDYIRSAKMHVQLSYELLLKNKGNSTGAIFFLTNIDRDNWKKTDSLDVTSGGNVIKNVFFLPQQEKDE